MITGGGAADRRVHPQFPHSGKHRKRRTFLRCAFDGAALLGKGILQPSHSAWPWHRSERRGAFKTSGVKADKKERQDLAALLFSCVYLFIKVQTGSSASFFVKRPQLQILLFADGPISKVDQPFAVVAMLFALKGSLKLFTHKLGAKAAVAMPLIHRTPGNLALPPRTACSGRRRIRDSSSFAFHSHAPQ